MLKLTLAAVAVVGGVAMLCPICEGGVRPVVAATPASTVSQADTAKTRLAVRGMTCGSCAVTARLALERTTGVYRAEVSYDSASALVLYDPAQTSPDRFIARLRELTGYEAEVAASPEPRREAP